MQAIVATVLGVALCLIILIYSAKPFTNVNFVTCAVLAGGFFYSQIISSFDPQYQMFGVLCWIVLSIGAIVGGVVGILLPRLSISLTLGGLVALLTCLVLLCCNQLDIVRSFKGIVFFATIVGTLVCSYRWEVQSAKARNALTAGLVAAFTADIWMQNKLSLVMFKLLQLGEGHLEEAGQWRRGLFWALLLWTAAAALSLAVVSDSARKLDIKRILSRFRLRRSRRGGYAPISTIEQTSALSGLRASSSSTQQSVQPGSTKSAGKPIRQQRTFNFPMPSGYNYVDIDDLPESLAAPSEMVFDLAHTIMREFGFQIDNSRNQAEHLLMMLYNETTASDRIITAPAMRIHTKLFRNYYIWCARMSTTPLLLRDVYQHHSSYDMLLEDILVYLFIWGEAANLKHMPECMCYLLHKSMQEHHHTRSKQTVVSSYQSGHSLLKPKSPRSAAAIAADTKGMSKYPGYYLDMVVTPLYEVVSESFRRPASQNERMTYDDFNEFFWSPACLRYEIHFSVNNEELEGGLVGSSSGRSSGKSSRSSEFSSSDLAFALKTAGKTYVEKRSWLHPLLAMNRVFEWHVLAFTVLTVVAFSSYLQWSYAYSLQVGSFVFWEITFFCLLWTSLEVWTLFPLVSIPTSAICGYLVKLLIGYLVLVYQSIYFHWSFVAESDADSALSSVSMFAQGDGMFWWWQYVWLSLVACSLYLLQACLSWFPSVASAVISCDNDFVQAFLAICYPFSQKYVGKNVHVPQMEVFQYIFFWLTLLAFKLWFGYYYVVSPITVPTIQLYDDYMNFPRVSFLKVAALMFFWWLPHFLVFIIDMSIWYSVWSAALGGCIAIVERQGAIRGSTSFRSHFMRAPVAFCQRLMPQSSALNQASTAMTSAASTASLTGIVPPFGTEVAHAGDSHRHNSYQQSGQFQSATHNAPSLSEEAQPLIASERAVNMSRKGPPTPRAKSSADLLSLHLQDQAAPRKATRDSSSSKSDHTEALFDAVRGEIINRRDYLNELDVRSQRWIVFARVWNEIVVRLYRTDYVSEKERDVMQFTYFEWLSKPVYLPLYMTAGCVNMAIVSFTDAHANFKREANEEEKFRIIERFTDGLSVTAKDALGETWELTYWFLQKLLGPKHIEDTDKIVNTLIAWAASNFLFSGLNAGRVQSIANHVANIVGHLSGVIDTRSSEPVVTTAFLAKQQEMLKSPSSAKDHSLPRHDWDSPSESHKSGSGSSGGGMKKSNSTGFLLSLGDHAVSGGDASAAGNNQSDKTKKFTKLLPFIKNHILSDKVRDCVRDELRLLFNDLRSALKEAATGGERVPGENLVTSITFLLSLESGFIWSDVYASAQIDAFCSDTQRTKPLLSKLNGLLRLRVSQVELKSYEASRRLNFFMNSLFMQMPEVPNSRYAKEYTCITPYHSEDILMNQEDLKKENEDGISTLLYLQTLHKEDWKNLLRRCDIKDENLIWTNKAQTLEVRMWASLRAQTLYRTVEGMMHSESAIRLFAELEELSTLDVEVLCKTKFQYVVACQIYGQMKKTLDSKADDIELLLVKFPNLRVAYIDEVRMNKHIEDVAYYSVLIKNDPEAASAEGAGAASAGSTKCIKEVYRVKLPGNPVLGEGKPENQNHALIFTRGRFLQAVDMNQDGYFEEALKMRNLLEEFDRTQCTILGFKEHIFTGSVSSIANYMAMQELSFVTLGQRVLNNPLRIRQHYGHPDLFNKFFVMTEGGMSKASRGINLSEDVFAGFNATIRGHSVQFKEYVQVGKGRDVGLQQTYKFEAKLSQGNAEQSLSRDLDRICNRLDFFRLLSFYYGGIGHYMANTLVMFTLVVVVYTMLSVAIFDQEGVNGRPMHPEGVLQMLMAGMGLLQTLPLLVTLTVEKGVMRAISEVSFMIISGGPLYFIFHIQTKCYYFSQTLMAGGAKYRPTGRGFVTRHSPFDENYRFFATSHIYLGFELLVALILLAIYTTSTQYGGLTWALWLAVAAFLLGPFWFNPMSFEWTPLVNDYAQFMSWMSEKGGSSEQSWEAWWREENCYVDSLSWSWRFFLLATKGAIWTFIGTGLAGTDLFRERREQERVLEVVGLFSFFLFGQWLLNKLERQIPYPVRRFVSIFLTTAVVIIAVTMFAQHTQYVRYTVAMYYYGAALSYLVLLLGGRHHVMVAYKVHDYLVANTIFVLLAILTALQVRFLQKVLLYHNALSEGVEVQDVLNFVRRTKAKNDTHQINVLKAQVLKQEQAIQSLVTQVQRVKDSRHDGDSGSHLSKTDTAADNSYSSGRSELELVEKAVSSSRKHLPPAHRDHRRAAVSPSSMAIPPLKMVPPSETVEDRGPVSILRFGGSRNGSPKVRGSSVPSSPVPPVSGVAFAHTTGGEGSGNGGSKDSLRDEAMLAPRSSDAASPAVDASSLKLSPVPASRTSSWVAQDVEAVPSASAGATPTLPDGQWQFTQPVNKPPR